MPLLRYLLRKFPENYLSPEDRLSEILFGLIMVLAIICATEIGLRQDEAGVRTMIIAAIGCNVAWGIVDAVTFVLGDLLNRARYGILVSKLKSLDEKEAFSLLEKEIGPSTDLILDESGKKRAFSEVIRSAPQLHPKKFHVSKDLILGAFACFLLVFVSTFPVLIPFFFMQNLRLATRVSNLIAIVMLFVLGYVCAKYTNQNRWKLGLVMMILGITIVIVTVLLGG